VLYILPLWELPTLLEIYEIEFMTEINIFTFTTSKEVQVTLPGTSRQKNI
jgi:hypothetical protein